VNNEGQGYRKTLDRIYMETKVGHDLNKKWSLTTSINFLSQFAKGYKYDKDVNGVEVATLISDISLLPLLLQPRVLNIIPWIILS